LLTALWPLGLIRRVPPALILRREVDGAWRTRSRYDPIRIAILPVAVAFAALVAWQAGSVRVAAIFLGGAAATLGLLAILARGLTMFARTSRWARGLAWRHGVANLGRPG